MEQQTLPIKDVLSYSRIDTFVQCPMKYKLKYIDKNYTDVTSIALEIGSLCHKGMELKYQGEDINVIWSYIKNGYKDDSEVLKGLNEIKDFYGFEYYETNEKSNMSYEDKLKIYKDKLFNEKLEGEWEVIGTEVDFLFTFNNKAQIQGKIDRIDKNIHTGDIRVIDYKTNNKPFNDKDLPTPLQMYIYSLACKELYGQYPVECIYDLIFLNMKQLGGTKGFLKRGEKKLNQILDSLIWYEQLGEDSYEPKPTPLCYWCPYCINNPNSDWSVNELCEYYLLWTPNEKRFGKNKEWK